MRRLKEQNRLSGRLFGASLIKKKKKKKSWDGGGAWKTEISPETGEGMLQQSCTVLLNIEALCLLQRSGPAVSAARAL